MPQPRIHPTTRRLLAALALSLVAHLLAGGGIPWPMADEDNLPLPPIEAVLQAPPPPAPLPAPSVQQAHQAKPRPATPSRVAQPAATAPIATVPLPEPEAPPSPASEAVAPPAPAVVAEAPPPPPPPPALPQLPASFRLRFVVQGNEGGLVLGRLDHVWRSGDGKYSIVGVAKATGLMGLIYSGLLSQTSDGTYTAAGLRPDNYWMQRGRKQFKAHFDWDRRQASLGGKYASLTLPDAAQDFLSVVYQLAFFPAPAGDLAVVNGKTLRQYSYAVLGRETLDLPIGPVQTRHIRVQTPQSEEGIELWLREASPHLPMKIMILDSKQGTGVLLVEEIEGLPPAAASASAVGKSAD